MFHDCCSSITSPYGLHVDAYGDICAILPSVNGEGHFILYRQKTFHCTCEQKLIRYHRLVDHLSSQVDSKTNQIYMMCSYPSVSCIRNDTLRYWIDHCVKFLLVVNGQLISINACTADAYYHIIILSYYPKS